MTGVPQRGSSPLTVQYDDGGVQREGYLYAVVDGFSRDWPGVALGVGVRADLTPVSFTDRRIETPHLLILSGKPDSGLAPGQDTYNAIGQGVYVVGQTVNYCVVNLSTGLSFTPVSWSGATAWSDPQYATHTFDEPGLHAVGAETEVGDGRDLAKQWFDCGYPQPQQEISVELLAEDYVAKLKLDTDQEKIRAAPVNSEPGEADNSMPMKIRLSGAVGMSAKVKLSVSGGGSVTIFTEGGAPYSAQGETVTVGTDLAAILCGTRPSAGKDDCSVKARTDKTGDVICATKGLTVFWIEIQNIHFRGSDDEGEPITEGSAAKFSDWQWYCHDEVGRFIYHKPEAPMRFDRAFWQMENKYVVTPNVVLAGLTWDMKREVTKADWGPEPDTLTYKGESAWAPDHPAQTSDTDEVQNEELPQLFDIDAPGHYGLEYIDGFRYTMKAKFRNWVEVKIGGKWYVCCQYKYWHAIMHIEYDDVIGNWGAVGTKTNEVLPGIGDLKGFAGSWEEDP